MAYPQYNWKPFEIVPSGAGQGFGAGVGENVGDVEVVLIPDMLLDEEDLISDMLLDVDDLVPLPDMLVPDPDLTLDVVVRAVFELADLDEVEASVDDDMELDIGSCLAARYPLCGINLTFDPWYKVQVFVDSENARLSHR